MSDDRHYTPKEIAAEVVAAARCRCVHRIGDFAVGSGELLRAASRRWPYATYVGVDIDGRAVSELARSHPSWLRCKADFLDPNATERAFKRMGCSGPFDLVLLNPPFSARKLRTVTVKTSGDSPLQCGRALAFVLRAINYCRRGGQVVAILPNSSRSSVRDRSAWEYLQQTCRVEPLHGLSDDTFPRCSASAEIVRFTVIRKGGRMTQEVASNGIGVTAYEPDAVIVRGSIPIHETAAKRTEIPVLHTTELNQNRAQPAVRFASKGRLLDQALHLLIPRVGHPRMDKLCLFEPTRMAISDCVIGIVGRTPSVTALIKNSIERNWKDFAELYRGTGAPYVGVLQLGSFLAANGYSWVFHSRQVSQTSICRRQPFVNGAQSEKSVSVA